MTTISSERERERETKTIAYNVSMQLSCHFIIAFDKLNILVSIIKQKKSEEKITEAKTIHTCAET